MNANALVKSQRDNFNSNTTKPIAFRIGQLKLFLSTLAPDYVLVHSSLEKAFLEKAKAEIIAADYSVSKGNYVQIINERNTSRILGLIDNNKAYFGGESNLESRHIAPTLMSNVTFEDRIMSEEIFGACPASSSAIPARKGSH